MIPVRQPMWGVRPALAAAVISLLSVCAPVAAGAESPAADGLDADRLACLEAIADPVEVPEPARASSDERSLIINRCLAQTGEFGAAMVRACAERDLASYEALLAYPEACAPFVVGCAKRVGQHGWGMVRICVDREIAGDQGQED